MGRIFFCAVLGFAAGSALADFACAQSVQTSPAQALELAERQSIRPATGLGRLDARLDVDARNPDPPLRLPRELQLTAVYRLRWDLTKGATGGLSLVQERLETNLPGATLPENAILGLDHLLQLALTPFLPVPPLADWSERLRSDTREPSGQRLLWFHDIPNPHGTWLAREIRNPLVWLDGTNRLQTLQHEKEDRVHRLEFQWEASQCEQGRCRLKKLVHYSRAIGPDAFGESRRELFVKEYKAIDGRELPSRVRITSPWSETERGWELEIQFGNYEIEKAQAVSAGKASPEMLLLQKAETRLYRLSAKVRRLEFQLALDAKTNLPESVGGFRATYQVSVRFLPDRPPGYELDCRLVSLEPEPPEAVPKNESLHIPKDLSARLATLVADKMQNLFEPVLGLPGAERRVDRMESDGDLTKFFLREVLSEPFAGAQDKLRESKDAGIIRPVILWVTKQGKVTSRAIEADGATDRRWFEWQEDFSTGELRLVSLRREHERPPLELPARAAKVHSVWDLSYENREGLWLPSAFSVRSRYEGQTGEMTESYRFSEYKIEK